MDDPNIGFVIASYAVAVTVLMALIIANVVSYRSQKRTIASFEEVGIRRRSDHADT
ncbi:MAG: heme exporter protein CcmD [Hyphomicrobiales bacterium]